MVCCASWTLGLWQLEFRAACDAYCKTVLFGKRSGLHVALVFNFFQLIMASNCPHRETHRRVKALNMWNEQILLSLRIAALFRFCLRAGAALHRLVTCCSCSFALGNLSKDVFEQRTLTRSDALNSVLICLDSTTFLLLSVFTLKDTICPKILAKPLPKNAKSPLPVDVRRLKTSLRQLPKFDAWLWPNISF